MKKIAIMQPYFFPYLGYWQLIKSVDKFIILDDVNFTKKSWVHRNNIISHENPEQINLCIRKASQNKFIKDLFLSEEHNWKNKLIKTIKLAYCKSLRYEEVIPTLEEVILNKETNLSEYLFYSIEKICKLLNINTVIMPSSSKYPKRDLTGQERIIDICLREKANAYINPMGGVSLYSKQNFKNSGILLNFIETKKGPSIIDHLMNYEDDRIQKNLNQYGLI